ncbi:hypothetical protein KC19_VG065800 [Ceratodon purpureus]|uniref:Secreted protein n=1 Tax=Ceratodon purpureus TaxID=3225 RepID=A0A8T0HMN2_CERPU|nr:hypothetical protein KC19_VG065800 [Ceratodon purpureus]
MIHVLVCLLSEIAFFELGSVFLELEGRIEGLRMVERGAVEAEVRFRFANDVPHDVPHDITDEITDAMTYDMCWFAISLRLHRLSRVGISCCGAL